jgi:hypothetical protein
VKEDHLLLSIADITIAMISNDPGLRLDVPEATNDFVVNGVDPDVKVKIAWGNLSREPCGKKLFDSGALWQLYHYNGSFLFCFTSPTFGLFPYKEATFDQDFKSGEVYLHHHFFKHDQPVYPLEYPLDELLITNLLAKGRGVEIHACGLIDSLGNGHLFVGQSGAGKTTMARLWQKAEGIEILSDDRIILRKIDGTLWMYGTPWHGEAKLASPNRAPLKQIYFLEKGIENELVLLGTLDAMGRLFASSFIPFYASFGIEFTIGFFQEIMKTIPCYKLKFVPDERIVEFVYEQCKAIS